jgi:hypothetical protein
MLRFDEGFERFRVRRLRIHNHSVWRERSPGKCSCVFVTMMSGNVMLL